MSFTELEHSELGKKSSGSSHYDKSLLFPIKRSLQREHLSVKEPLNFYGSDIWSAFEVSWLNEKNKPQVAVLTISIPADSENIIESKSLKLYLNSFNQHQLQNITTLVETIESDLSAVANATVTVSIESENHLQQRGIQTIDGTCLDDLDIEIDCFEPSAALLKTLEGKTSETLYSHLFKSNCPVTNQPDWASVVIRYQGNKLCHGGLLKYLISYRNHQGFHEWCVEQIYADISKLIQPESLMVYARFTRRGGLDINPIRASHPIDKIDNTRLFRQ